MAGFLNRIPRHLSGTTERFPGGHEQRPLLNSSAVILQNPIDEQGTTSVGSHWKGATNHARLRTTALWHLPNLEGTNKKFRLTTWLMTGLSTGHIYLSHSHPIAIYAWSIPWDFHYIIIILIWKTIQLKSLNLWKFRFSIYYIGLHVQRDMQNDEIYGL